MPRYQAHLTLKSDNTKTGPIPVSTTTRDTCPAACPLKNNGCYAEPGKLSIHWRKVTNGERGLPWDEFCNQIYKLPEGQLWRHNQAGDLPGSGDRLDKSAIQNLAFASYHTKGFTFTHYPIAGFGAHDYWNASIIRTVNRVGGLHINASCESLNQADLAIRRGIPAVVVVPEDFPVKGTRSSDGHHVTVCPAQYKDAVTCSTCKLCANPNRTCIVAFRVHGIGKKKAATAISSLNT